MTVALSKRIAADDVALRLAIEVREEPGAADWPLILSRHCFVARLGRSAEQVEGFGCASTVAAAREFAIMECLERYAQFQRTPPQLRRASGALLGEAVLPPESLGLYAQDQYGDPDFPFARYSPEATLDWVEVIDAASRQRYHVPAEFVYPRAAAGRKPLAAETSSGTAAHYSHDAALMGAVCELIERDSLLMFWHRQPETIALNIESSLSPEAAEDLENVRKMGYLTVVCCLQYDLPLPSVLALALRDNRFAWGAGCHPHLKDAVEHAVCELGRLVRWHVLESGGVRPWHYLSQVKKPGDHYALYDGGPFHSILRHTLAHTVRPGLPLPPALPFETLADIVRSLESKRFRVYECDLTPAEIRSFGVVIERALVPGLIPLNFGYNTIRLGCRRLWSRDAPGRFRTLLPHFMA